MRTAQQLASEIDLAQALADEDGKSRTVYVLPSSGGFVYLIYGHTPEWIETSGAVALCRVEPAAKAVAS